MLGEFLHPSTAHTSPFIDLFLHSSQKAYNHKSYFHLKRVTTKAYRGKYQIIAEMLNIINESDSKGVTKTSIMYNAFLSYAQLKEYLPFLLENGLIDEIPLRIKYGGSEKFVYKITEKGIRLMQISKEIENIIGVD
jgi:predicted transcriptional regulator